MSFSSTYNSRLDRFLTLYFFYPLAQIFRRSDKLKIPILMYHSISDNPENGVHPYYKINTSPEIFEDQMRFLYENHYTVMSLSDIKEYGELEKISSVKPVVITFDDGYHDFYIGAFPILQKYHLTAAVFLPTSFIGNEGLQLKGKKHLSWTEVKALSERGITFGSHTVTHPHLSTLKDEEVEYEIKRSKETIEDKLGQAIDTFSYPFKFPEANWTFVKLLRDLLQKNGYRCGVSTRIGTTSKNDEVYFMKRIPVNSGDDISLFQAKLEGGYDWIYHIQRLSKFMSSKT